MDGNGISYFITIKDLLAVFKMMKWGNCIGSRLNLFAWNAKGCNGLNNSIHSCRILLLWLLYILASRLNFYLKLNGAWLSLYLPIAPYSYNTWGNGCLMMELSIVHTKPPFIRFFIHHSMQKMILFV